MIQRIVLVILVGLCLGSAPAWAEPWAIAASAAPMVGSVSCTNLTSGGSSTDLSTYTTDSVTPTGNALVLVYVSNWQTSADPDVPTISGNDLTYVQIATATNADGVTRNRTTVFRALESSPTAGIVTIDFAGTSQIAGGWSVDECTGIDIGGTDGEDAIVQSATESAGCDNVATCTVTLAAFGSVNNATYGAFATSRDDAVSGGTDFTVLSSDTTASSPTRSRLVEWTAANDTSVDADNGDVGTDWSAVAIEIKAAAVTGGGKIIGGGVF